MVHCWHLMKGNFNSLLLSLSPASAFLWQLMRFSMIQLLKNLRSHQGKEITDAVILNWANYKVKKAGRNSQMESFKVIFHIQNTYDTVNLTDD